MKDMEKAVSRFRFAGEMAEKITVYGDYDVDGVTSTALLVSFLRSEGYRVEYYIPDRYQEGYGLNKEALLATAKMEQSFSSP
jgi:single-stranded-DNA-specific exonuclease